MVDLRQFALKSGCLSTSLASKDLSFASIRVIIASGLPQKN